MEQQDVHAVADRLEAEAIALTKLIAGLREATDCERSTLMATVPSMEALQDRLTQKLMQPCRADERR